MNPDQRTILSWPVRTGARVLTWVTLGILAALPAAADVVLEITRSTELWRPGDTEAPADRTQEHGVLYLNATQVRFDQGTEVSWILDTEAAELVLVRHDLHVYHVFATPLVLESYASGPELALLEERSAQAATKVEVVETGATRQVEGYRARQVTVRGRPPTDGASFEYELWLSDEVPGDHELYRAIVREFGAADVVMRPLARRLAELSGFPVLRRSVTTFGDGLRSIDERRLTSVAERSLSASTYEPPASYLEQPFSISEWLTLR